MLPLELNIGFVVYAFYILSIFARAEQYIYGKTKCVLSHIGILLLCIIIGFGVSVCIEQIIELLK